MKFKVINDILLRREPIDLSAFECKLFNGDIVYSLDTEKTNNWYHVITLNGKKGWILDQYLNQIGQDEGNMDEYTLIKKILEENDLLDYFPIFEQNKLISFYILNEITEEDYEKIGISIIGDRKKLIKLFFKKDNKETNEEITPKQISQSYQQTYNNGKNNYDDVAKPIALIIITWILMVLGLIIPSTNTTFSILYTIGELVCIIILLVNKNKVSKINGAIMLVIWIIANLVAFINSYNASNRINWQYWMR